MAEGNNNMTYEMKYDNRFGHAEYLAKATWTMEESRHGEIWLFKFPNGREVSVARNATWQYQYVSMGLSMAATYGYLRGLYECVTFYGGEYSNEEGYMEFDEVIAYLDKVQEIPS